MSEKVVAVTYPVGLSYECDKVTFRLHLNRRISGSKTGEGTTGEITIYQGVEKDGAPSSFGAGLEEMIRIAVEEAMEKELGTAPRPDPATINR